MKKKPAGYSYWLEDQNRFIQETRRFSEQLSETPMAEKNFSIHEADCAWDVESIKEEAEALLEEKETEKKGK